MRKVKLYGELAEFVGHKEFDVEVSTTAQAVSFLVNNFPQVEAHMANKYYKVLVDKQEVIAEELHYPIGQSDIKFVPVVTGAGGNFGKILLGAALIGFSLMMPGGGLFGNTAFGVFGGRIANAGVSAGSGTAASAIGASLVLSGVSGMLFPVPKMPEFSSEQDPRISFSFSGTQQTSRAGTPVPIVYGEIFTGSVVISAGVDTHQVSA